jgi:Family of unknown function (DUF6079)
MTVAERGPIEAYIAQADPEAPLPEGLVNAANQALRGVHTIALRLGDIVAAIQSGGLPCTMDELKQRFSSYLQDAVRGHDPSTTRLTLHQD